MTSSRKNAQSRALRSGCRQMDQEHMSYAGPSMSPKSCPRNCCSRFCARSLTSTSRWPSSCAPWEPSSWRILSRRFLWGASPAPWQPKITYAPLSKRYWLLLNMVWKKPRRCAQRGSIYFRRSCRPCPLKCRISYGTIARSSKTTWTGCCGSACCPRETTISTKRLRSSRR